MSPTKYLVVSVCVELFVAFVGVFEYLYCCV